MTFFVFTEAPLTFETEAEMLKFLDGSTGYTVICGDIVQIERAWKVTYPGKAAQPAPPAWLPEPEPEPVKIPMSHILPRAFIKEVERVHRGKKIMTWFIGRDDSPRDEILGQLDGVTREQAEAWLKQGVESGELYDNAV